MTGWDVTRPRGEVGDATRTMGCCGRGGGKRVLTSTFGDCENCPGGNVTGTGLATELAWVEMMGLICTRGAAKEEVVTVVWRAGMAADASAEETTEFSITPYGNDAATEAATGDGKLPPLTPLPPPLPPLLLLPTPMALVLRAAICSAVSSKPGGRAFFLAARLAAKAPGAAGGGMMRAS